MMIRRIAIALPILSALVFPAPNSRVAHPKPKLVEWDRGVALQTPGAGMTMYLWFYEWNMFEAMAGGQHTPGTYKNRRRLAASGTSAEIIAPALHLTMKTIPGGADLTLKVTNITGDDWPEIAGIIACWNPGRVEGSNPSSPLPLNRNFADPEKKRTFFIGPSGPTPLTTREIHFNRRFRPLVDRASAGKSMVFSPKWPTSEVNAAAGYIIRESEDGEWVTGVGWEDYLSVQGHNPWSCMHACVRVGPLAPKQSKTIRGKLYLFRGKMADAVQRFEKELGSRR